MMVMMVMMVMMFMMVAMVMMVMASTGPLGRMFSVGAAQGLLLPGANGRRPLIKTNRQETPH